MISFSLLSKVFSFGLSYLFGLYWIKLFVLKITRDCIIRYYINPITRDFYFRNSNLHEMLENGINSHCFKNGVLNLFFNINEYKVSAKDVAVSIKMAEINSKYDSSNNNYLVNFSYYFINELGKRIKTDNIFKLYIKQLGKDYSYIDFSDCRDEIEDSLKNKKSLIKSYYDIYANKNYSDLITIYFPAEDHSYLDYSEENSLTVKTYLADIPEGFFLLGLDYYCECREWLKIAYVKKDKEFFNSSEINGKYIWVR